jgi:hypothetical protein
MTTPRGTQNSEYNESVAIEELKALFRSQQERLLKLNDHKIDDDLIRRSTKADEHIEKLMRRYLEEFGNYSGGLAKRETDKITMIEKEQLASETNEKKQQAIKKQTLDKLKIANEEISKLISKSYNTLQLILNERAKFINDKAELADINALRKKLNYQKETFLPQAQQNLTKYQKIAEEDQSQLATALEASKPLETKTLEEATPSPDTSLLQAANEEADKAVKKIAEISAALPGKVEAAIERLGNSDVSLETAKQAFTKDDEHTVDVVEAIVESKKQVAIARSAAQIIQAITVEKELKTALTEVSTDNGKAARLLTELQQIHARLELKDIEQVNIPGALGLTTAKSVATLKDLVDKGPINTVQATLNKLKAAKDQDSTLDLINEVKQNGKNLESAPQTVATEAENTKRALSEIQALHSTATTLLAQRSAEKQKELYEKIVEVLTKEIPYWEQQRSVGGTEIFHNGKFVTVPTGIGEMINAINPPPEKPKLSIKTMFGKGPLTQPETKSISALTPTEINTRLQTFQDKAKARQQAQTGFFAKNVTGRRRDSTQQLYDTLSNIGSDLNNPKALTATVEKLNTLQTTIKATAEGTTPKPKNPMA